METRKGLRNLDLFQTSKLLNKRAGIVKAVKWKILVARRCAIKARAIMVRKLTTQKYKEKETGILHVRNAFTN